MRRLTALLLAIPALGLVELGLHGFFAARAPDAAEYAALGPELAKLKQKGVPLVVAPTWAEPWLRQAVPEAFPLTELARADDRSFTAFLEVSLLGQSAPELKGFPVESEWAFGAFRVRRRRNPHPEPTRYDFVTALEQGSVEVFVDQDEQPFACEPSEQPRSETGGLHGHVAYPRQRYQCPRGRLVGVTLIEDQAYRPRRCILVQAPDSGSVVLRFAGVPAARRLVGFGGASFFLEREASTPQIELGIRVADGPPELRSFAFADGLTRFEQALSGPAGAVEVRVRRLTRYSPDFCFGLEAR
jgi:hypothetical protein